MALRAKTRPHDKAEEERLWGHIASVRRSYHIARREVGGAADDEASIAIVITLIDLPAWSALAQAKMDLRLICAQHYEPGSPRSASPFFGSVSLRKDSPMAFAYVPQRPFWQLPALISNGASWVRLGFDRGRGETGDLISILVCDDKERCEVESLQA